MNKSQVISAWANGRYARTANESLTSYSDGRLKSYNLLIGIRTTNGFVVGDFTASGEYHSNTTSTHVGNASRVAKIVPVDDFKIASIWMYGDILAG